MELGFKAISNGKRRRRGYDEHWKVQMNTGRMNTGKYKMNTGKCGSVLKKHVCRSWLYSLPCPHLPEPEYDRVSSEGIFFLNILLHSEVWACDLSEM
jgi:hypothetical protein